MKITFVYPDFESIGVQQLMAVCLENGFETDFIYYEAEDQCEGKPIALHAGQIAQKIAATNPDVVAFSCVTVNYLYQLGCARALKAIRPGLVTVFGGIHPTAVPDRVLSNPEVDCVCIGEGEIAFAGFLKAGSKAGRFTLPNAPVRGMAFKKNGAIVGEFAEGELADLNTLPFPHKDPFYQTFKYLSGEYRILTSRGCPYHCSYCFNSHYQQMRGKNIFRQRTVDNVIEELKWAKNRYSLKYIFFMDDSFTTDAQWLYEFCRRYHSEIALPFCCIANPHYIDEKKARALSEAGCVYMQIGVQSVSEELCASFLLRKSSNAKLLDAISSLKKAGIMVQLDHMLGIPGDTLEWQEESVRFYNSCRPNLISVYWLTYYPKTAIIDLARKCGLLSASDIENIETGRFQTRKEVSAGGSMQDPKPFFGIDILLNYLPILPKFLVSLILESRLYRRIRTKNFYLSVALPRVIQSVFDRRDLVGRSHIKYVWHKMMNQALGRKC